MNNTLKNILWAILTFGIIFGAGYFFYHFLGFEEHERKSDCLEEKAKEICEDKRMEFSSSNDLNFFCENIEERKLEKFRFLESEKEECKLNAKDKR